MDVLNIAGRAMHNDTVLHDILHLTGKFFSVDSLALEELLGHIEYPGLDRANDPQLSSSWVM